MTLQFDLGEQSKGIISQEASFSFWQLEFSSWLSENLECYQKYIFYVDLYLSIEILQFVKMATKVKST